MPRNTHVLAAWRALRRDKRTKPAHRILACAILRDGRVPTRDKHFKALGFSNPKAGRAALDDLRSWLGAS